MPESRVKMAEKSNSNTSKSLVDARFGFANNFNPLSVAYKFVRLILSLKLQGDIPDPSRN